ncbi:MAG: hypothetical protein NT175_11160 [Bacteroidetes bacterium]|nr:hypothetical protein [Bacteroidota bacterium]
MKIARNNYEIFFVDYSEGALSPLQVDELAVFLDHNPDLKEEFEAFENIRLVSDETISFPGKHNLKKNIITSVRYINASNYDQYFIAELEGDLNNEDKELVTRFIDKNPFLKNEYLLLKATVLEPDNGIIFPGKQALKKRALFISGRRLIYYSITLAAALLILFLLFNPMRKQADDSRTLAGFTKSDTAVYQGKDMDRPTNQKSNVTAYIPEMNPESLPIKAVISGQIPTMDSALLPFQNRDLTPLTKLKGNYATAELQIINTSEYNQEENIVHTRNYLSRIPPYLFAVEDYMTDLAQTNKPEDYNSIFAYGYAKIRKLFKKEPKDEKKSSDFSFWALADLGVIGINHLTNSDFRIERVTDKNGKILSYQVGNENFEISRTK